MRRLLRRIRWHLRSPLDNAVQADLDRLREERTQLAQLARVRAHNHGRPR